MALGPSAEKDRSARSLLSTSVTILSHFPPLNLALGDPGRICVSDIVGLGEFSQILEGGYLILSGDYKP